MPPIFSRAAITFVIGPHSSCLLIVAAVKLMCVCLSVCLSVCVDMCVSVCGTDDVHRQHTSSARSSELPGVGGATSRLSDTSSESTDSDTSASDTSD